MSRKNRKSKAEVSNREVDALFALLNPDKDGGVEKIRLWEELHHHGIMKTDPRLSSVCELLEIPDEDCDSKLDKKIFKQLLERSQLIYRALSGSLIIPDFEKFTNELKEIFDETRKNDSGNVASYIPQLAKVDPSLFALSIHTVDGQVFSLGDHETEYCLQSTCKPINYLIAAEELGEDEVHKYIGKEPSGRSFNEMALNHENLPHNPLINSGAIMCCSLIGQGQNMDERFDSIRKTWHHLTGKRETSFNNAVYQSEKRTADRNHALAYMMREKKAFPEGTDLDETLDLYFQSCSIEVTASMMSSAASVLANGGVHPATEEQLFSPENVKNCLTLMNTCGMYDFSGEFAFKVGLPAKSSVSGALMVVVPNVMGITIWSPLLDDYGNSVRGVEFCSRMVDKYNFHNYDNLLNHNEKIDPRKKKFETSVEQVIALIMAAAKGDMGELQRLEAIGVSLSCSDYDGRTPLHLAAAEGHTDIVRYLLQKGVDTDKKDRWDRTASDDAAHVGNEEIENLITEGIS
jgi:glutaminase